MAETLKGKKVVVIGTGMGGSSVAALLAREGADVTVLERNSYPGGKAASFERDGFIYDTGVHWLARGNKGPMGEVASIVGTEIEFVTLDTAMEFTTGGHTAVISQNMDEDESLQNLFEEIGVSHENREGAKTLFKDLARERTPEELEALDEVSFSDYIARFVDDEQINRLLDGFTGMYMCISRRAASTGEFILCFSTQSKQKNLCYPVGGMRAVPMAYLDAMQSLGGELRYSTPVERIVVEGGEVRGVDADGFIPADIVISNNGVKETVALAGRHNFPDDYLSMVDSLRLSFGAVSVKYALDAEIVKAPLACYFPDFRDPELVERQAAIFVPVPSIADPSLAPPGCQLVLAGSLAPPGLEEPEQAKAVCNEMLDRIENTMQDLYPGIEDHVIWKIRTDTRYIAEISGRLTGEVIGVAQNRHQVGNKRPSSATPVRGLYLVGADAGGRGVGTEMAVDSALNLWRLLRNE
ncbi:MAG: NAD(P)/FAD-dependent oxidoreductase [Actinomycetota bacterium]|nr:NAD(P)/FAD-dependent oxidoreductase [Actinomycetota bacterium]MDD5666740.1 NAD(P)/FAD-dependent oxidoreductase [Actinomycetota bacterium]